MAGFRLHHRPQSADKTHNLQQGLVRIKAKLRSKQIEKVDITPAKAPSNDISRPAVTNQQSKPSTETSQPVSKPTETASASPKSKSSSRSKSTSSDRRTFRRATMPSSGRGRQHGYIPVHEQPVAPQYVVIEQTRTSGISISPSSSKGSSTPKTIVFAGNSRHYLAQISRPKVPRRKEVPRAWTRTDQPSPPPVFQLSRPGQSRYASEDGKTKPIPIVDSAVCLNDAAYGSSYSTTVSSTYSEDGFSSDSDALSLGANTHAADARVQRYALPADDVDYVSQKMANVQLGYAEPRRV